MQRYIILVVYKENKDKELFLKEKIEYCNKYNHKYIYDKYSQYLTIEYGEYYYGPFQEQYRLMGIKHQPLSRTICGLQLSGVQFLKGEYSHEDINYAMSKIRGGPWEAEPL